MSATPRGEPLAYLHAHLDDDTAECVVWPYGVNSAGYGRVWVAGALRSVHVVACEHAHGPRPPGMEAAHAPVICHTPLCFNGRRHLSWKTSAQNKADRIADGTHLAGESAPAAKLTLSQVRIIRSRHAAGGVSQASLAREFAMAPSAISMIINGQRWRESA